MRNMLAITTAAAALLFTGSAGFAQTEADPRPYYVQDGEDGVIVYREDEMDNRVTVLGDETFAAPGECPEGSLYRSSATTLTACGEGGMVYNLTDIEEGAMMSNNEPFPEGTSMVATPTPSGKSN